MATKARYTGNGTEFLNGVPARDLSDDEYEALSKDARHLVTTSGLYELVAEQRVTRAGKEG